MLHNLIIGIFEKKYRYLFMIDTLISISSNSEAFAPELHENLEYMLPRYYNTCLAYLDI